ncbi:MAG: LysM peptidoglycan-binding domain-containing protein [Gemmatimonadetes bacterium]|nr:LysM peptidoglycan-binding domain-containing protein [Gemmatimonadota bacterium]
MKRSIPTSIRRLVPGAAYVAALAAAAPLGAQQQADSTQAGRNHEVRRGDTLWDLARQYLGDPFQWPRIYEANRSRIKDPHWIYPNQRLFIPGVGWVQAKAAPGEAAVAAAPVAEADGGRDPSGQPRTRFFPRPRAEERVPAPEELPAVTRREMLATPWLGDTASLQVVGELLEGVDPRTGGGRLAQQFEVQDRVYLRYGPAGRPAVGDRLLLVRRGAAVPGWGFVLEPVGVVAVERTAHDVMTARLVEQFGPVLETVKAIPLPDFADAPLATEPVRDGPVGRIVQLARPGPLPTPADVVFVDLGRSTGLEPGDELEAYLAERPAARSPATQLPEERVARLRVARVEERSASARIVALDEAVVRPGLKVRLVRKAP